MYKIFDVSSSESIKLISAYTGVLPIDEVLEVQRCRFVKSLGTDISIVHSLFYIVFKRHACV